MFKNSLIVLSFLFMGLHSHAQPAALSCSGILAAPFNQPAIEDSLDFISELESQLESFQPIKGKLDNKDFIAFGKTQGSLKILQSSMSKSMFGIRHLFWFVIEEQIFAARGIENAAVVSRLEKLLAGFTEVAWVKQGTDLTTLLLQSKKPKTARSAKTYLIRALQNFSLFFNELNGTELDLTKADDLLTFFGVDSKIALTKRVEDLYLKNKEIGERVQPFVSYSLRDTATIMSDLTHYFFGSTQIPMLPEEKGFFEKRPTEEETTDLIKKLRLHSEDEAFYLNDLATLKASLFIPNTDNSPFHVANALLILKASESLFGLPNLSISGSLSFQYETQGVNSTFGQKPFLAVVNNIKNAEFARIIAEERMAGYIDLSDAINARQTALIRDANRVMRQHRRTQEEVQTILTASEDLKVEEFDQNLEEIQRALTSLEIKLDGILESVLKAKRNESIVDFYDLNNRWTRLLPDHKYELEGVDYEHVQFSKDVIDFFKNDPILGARYLAALSKSYVPVLKHSGLRRLPSIHPEFRDIKSIRHHGKVRIVGRLVGSTIHFFHIHDSEKSYVNRSMKIIIENFTP